MIKEVKYEVDKSIEECGIVVKIEFIATRAVDALKFVDRIEELVKTVRRRNKNA